MMQKITEFPVVIALLVFVGLPGLAVAQTQGSNDSQDAIEEVVVTASKRGEVSLQDIAMSATVLGGDFLNETGQVNFLDFFAQVPGLSINNKGPGDKQIVIRGVNSNGAGTVSLYFDEVIITGEGEGDFGRAPDIKTFDLERIEVLKGPQGTTFGSSALSGTIRYIPVKPNFDQFDAEVGGAVNSQKHSNDIGWRGQAMINIPLSENLAVRFSGLSEFDQGYLDNRFEDDTGSDRVDALRAMIRWQASENFEFSSFAMFQERDVIGRNFFNDTTANLNLSPTLNGQALPPLTQAVLARGRIVSNIDMYNVKGVYSSDWGSVTATSSLYQRFTNVERTTSFASEVLFGIPADNGGQSFIARDRDQEIWSNELRFASNWDKNYQVLFGAFYKEEDLDERSPFVYNLDPASGRQVPESLFGRQEIVLESIDELAFFGELEFNITDQLKIMGGIRWFDLDINSTTESIIQFLGRPGSGPGPILQFGESDVIYKAGISYNVTSDAMAYFQFSQGFRPGGANDESPENIPGIIIDIPPGFGSDGLDNYEIGFKTSLFDGRLLVNVAAYVINWSDIQAETRVESDTGLSFAIRGNGGSAEIKGIEMSVSARPIEGLTWTGGFNYNDAKLTENFPNANDGVDGDRIPHTPKFTSFINFRYEKPIPGNFLGVIGGDWIYRTSTSNQFRPVDAFAREIASHAILDLRAGVERDNWDIMLRVKNVLDADDIISYTFDFQFPNAALSDGQFLPDYKVRIQPRTLELAFRYRFN